MAERDSMSDEQKTRFEAWWHEYLKTALRVSTGGDLWTLGDTPEEIAWRAWKAAEARTDERIASLHVLAGDAIDSIEEWAVYASEYFQEKHRLQEQLSEYRNRLTESSTAEHVLFRLLPHESYAENPDEFWEWFHVEHPEVSREEMVRALEETAESKMKGM